MYFAQINGGGGSSISKPKDLHIPTGNTTKDDEIKELNLGKDYFDIVVDNLILNTEYFFQFAWKYEDGSYSEWSASKTFSTSLESAPAVPSQPTVTAGPGLINVTWNGNNAAGTTLQNYEKVNIYVDGTYKDSFFAAGTKSIPLAKGTYAVTLRSSSSTNVVSDATSPAVSATVTTDATDAAAAQSSANSALSQLLNKLSIGGGVVANPTTQQLTDISLSQGIKIYTSAGDSGNRVILNSNGIAGWYNNETMFSINTATGDAFFKGEIGASRITAALTMTAGNSLNIGPESGTANRSNIIISSTSSSLAKILFDSYNSSGVFTSHAIYSSEFALSIYPNGASSGAMSFFGSNATIPNRIVVRNEMRYTGLYSDFGGNSSAMNSNLSPFFRNILFGLSDPPTTAATDYAPGTIYLAYTE